MTEEPIGQEMPARERIVGIIPARWESRRFPGKVVTPILGRPLLEWVIRVCRGSENVGKWIVATDDDRVAQLAESCGAEAVISPSDLRTGSDRSFWVTREMDVDWIINVQADELFFDSQLVDDLLAVKAADQQCPVATLARPIELSATENPNLVKVVFDRYRRALYFSRAPIPHRRNDHSSAPVLRHGRRLWHGHIGMYAFTKEILARYAAANQSALETCESLEQLRFMEMGIRIHVGLATVPSWRIDAPEDVQNAETDIRKLKGTY